MKNGNQYRVQSIYRAISILKLFLDSPGSLSLTEINRNTGLNQVTAFRLVSTLVDEGFLEQSPESGKYRLGVTAMALGEAYFQSNDLRHRAYPKLVELRDQCGETVHLAILDGDEIVYIEKLQGLHPIGLMSSRVGGRAPAHCTGVGKVLLAHQPVSTVYALYKEKVIFAHTSNTITSLDRLLVELSKIKEHGYSLDNEEHELGVACVAAPIFDRNGIMAAISVSGPSYRIMKSKPEIIKLVTKIALEISFLFGSDHTILTPSSESERK